MGEVAVTLLKTGPYRTCTRLYLILKGQTGTESCMTTVSYLEGLAGASLEHGQGNVVRDDLLAKLEKYLRMWDKVVPEMPEKKDWEYLFQALVMAHETGDIIEPGSATELMSLMLKFRKESNRKPCVFRIVRHIADTNDWWKPDEKENGHPLLRRTINGRE